MQGTHGCTAYYLGGVVGEEDLFAVAERGDGREGALAFPAPLAQ
jgi:hypothetical protein